MVAKTITRKKNVETVKEELSNSLRESETVEESDFDIQKHNWSTTLKHREEITKTGNKNTVRYESIQGQMLKKFKDTAGFVENVRLSRSTIYFKEMLGFE